jgi:hypothetical protein
VAYVILIFFCGLSAGIIGKLKGSSFWIWFAVGLVLPVIGSIAAALYRNERREPGRQCPECGKLQPLYVQVCTGCGRDLDWPDEVIPAR